MKLQENIGHCIRQCRIKNGVCIGCWRSIDKIIEDYRNEKSKRRQTKNTVSWRRLHYNFMLAFNTTCCWYMWIVGARKSLMRTMNGEVFNHEHRWGQVKTLLRGTKYECEVCNKIMRSGCNDTHLKLICKCPVGPLKGLPPQPEKKHDTRYDYPDIA